jgi:hypothetical protein
LSETAKANVAQGLQRHIISPVCDATTTGPDRTGFPVLP